MKNKINLNKSSFKIPTGWKYIPFGEVFEFVPTLSLSREQLTLENTDNNIYNIHYGDIHATYDSNILDFDIEKRIPRIKDEIEIKTITLLKDGDLAIADASEDYEGVGASIELKNVNGKKATGGLHTFIARDLSGLTEIGFRNYVLKNPIVAKELKKLATGSKVYGISKTNLASLKILLPEKKEQKGIAKIFHSWDIAIEAVENLIKRKERNRKSLMQKTLTGEKRFKKFIKAAGVKKSVIGKIPKDWSAVSIGQLTKHHKQGYYTQEEYKSISKYYLLRGTDMLNTHIDLSSTPKINASTKDYEMFKVEPGDFLIVRSGAIGRYGIVTNVTPPSIFGSYLIKFQFEKELMNEFFGYIYESPVALNQLRGITQGSTNININAENIKTLIVPLPSVREQQAIVSCLKRRDEEIEILKSQLNYYKNQKKGLMQILLTGKKRMKISNEKSKLRK